MGKDLHLHYGSAVMLPMMRMLGLFLFSHKVSHFNEPGFDICWARLHVLGFDVYYDHDTSFDLDFSGLLMKPLQLARGNELFDLEFVNILHALQVVQYYCWKWILARWWNCLNRKWIKLID
ncbi:hypothetical protein ACJW31_03G088400 [Castanea mollissima]